LWERTTKKKLSKDNRSWRNRRRRKKKRRKNRNKNKAKNDSII